MPNETTPQLLLRLPQVKQATGLSRSTVYRWIGQGTFPAPVLLGGNIVAWRQSDLNAWINSRQPSMGRERGGALAGLSPRFPVPSFARRRQATRHRRQCSAKRRLRYWWT